MEIPSNLVKSRQANREGRTGGRDGGRKEPFALLFPSGTPILVQWQAHQFAGKSPDGVQSQIWHHKHCARGPSIPPRHHLDTTSTLMIAQSSPVVAAVISLSVCGCDDKDEDAADVESVGNGRVLSLTSEAP